MALRKRPIAAGIAALVFSGYVSALGLGEIKLNSALNEPLDAEIPLINLGELSDSELIAGLATEDDFDNAGVDREYILTNLVFEIDLDSPGGPVLRVFSKKPIREPYLDFLVDVQWPAGRLLREYTLLLDLPVYAGGTFSKKNIDPPRTSPRGVSTRSAVSSPRAPQQQVALDGPVVDSGNEYQVRDGDTLWGIASSIPSSASVHQRMAAIQQLNPSAFINGDINLLKRGEVLRLPDYGALSSSSARQVSTGAASSDRYAPEYASTARSSGARAPADDGGHLSLSAGDGDGGRSSGPDVGGSGSSQLRGEIFSIQEELDRSRRENDELKQRLASLEDQISTMQRLMEIGNDDLRAAQLAGVASESAEDTYQDSVETTQDSGVDEAPVEHEENFDSPALALFPSSNTGGARQRPVPVESGSEATGQQTVDATDADTEKSTADGTVASDAADTETAQPSTAPPVKMNLKTEEGWFDKVNGYLTALLALLVVVIGAIVVFVLRRGKKEESEDTYFEPPAESFTPPPSPVRERPREEPPKPQPPEASSIDDIDLREEDDLFAEPPVSKAPAPSPAPATPPPAPKTPAPVQTSPSEESLEDMELDLSEFELEDGDQEPAGQAASAAASELNLDEEFDFLGDIDEGDTQLELAQAYIEMGDQAGAREILLEVAEGGNDEQKAKARQLMEQLG